MKTESLDKSIDVLIDTIMKSTIKAVDENRIEDSRALFDEFVVDLSLIHISEPTRPSII